jgi:hypothetical protein
MDFTQKSTHLFHCEKCAFSCVRKPDWNRHLTTAKHFKLINVNVSLMEKAQKFICEICQKEYKSNVGLWKHKKICKPAKEDKDVINLLINENKELINENKDFKNLILEMMKNNTELQKQMLDVCKHSNNNITHNNSHNKTFNMQFFLNEQCKDAMNITDFIDSFQLQFSDLERVGELGYVDGISDIIIKKLNEMDVYKRPIHCSDTKRDIMYVRAENVWEKETNGHDRLRLFIKQITHKNIKLIPLWAETHPQAKDHEHPLNDNYLSMVSQAMGGRGNLEESENKIIKRIAKTVYIDKY